ncbi:hypothetical protein KEM55_007856 [Ascosphaera atra]|nr:hypothetical protein KEM55_007856 [Ascosphaera atra]
MASISLSPAPGGHQAPHHLGSDGPFHAFSRSEQVPRSAYAHTLSSPHVPNENSLSSSRRRRHHGPRPSLPAFSFPQAPSNETSPTRQPIHPRESAPHRRRTPATPLPAFSFPQAPESQPSDDVLEEKRPRSPLPSFSFPQAPEELVKGANSASHAVTSTDSRQPEIPVEEERPRSPLPTFSFPQAPEEPIAEEVSTSNSQQLGQTPEKTRSRSPLPAFSFPQTPAHTSPCEDDVPISPKSFPPIDPSRNVIASETTDKNHHFPSLSVPPRPDGSTGSRRHAHRRSAAMSGLDVESIAKAKSTLSTTPPPPAVPLQAPQIRINGEPTDSSHNRNGSASTPSFPRRYHFTHTKSTLSTISSEGSVTSTTPSPAPVEAAPTSVSSSYFSSLRRKDRSKTASLSQAPDEMSPSQQIAHRRTQTALPTSTNETKEQRPVSRSKQKNAKKSNKERSWAGFFTRKSKKKQQPSSKKSRKNQPAPADVPEGLARSTTSTADTTLIQESAPSDDSSDVDINFDDDTIVIEEPASQCESGDVVASTSSFESSWKPKSFYDQARQLSREANVMGPVIDLDAALGPFQTPNTDETGSGFSLAARRMHSGGRRTEFLACETPSRSTPPYHRRAESAPATPPLERPGSTSRYSVASMTFKNPDIFDEEEEDAFLANSEGQSQAPRDQRNQSTVSLGDNGRPSDVSSKGPFSAKEEAFGDTRKSLHALGISTAGGIGQPDASQEHPLPPETPKQLLHACDSERSPDTTPELSSPTPRSQHPSSFSSPSNSSISVLDTPRGLSSLPYRRSSLGMGMKKDDGPIQLASNSSDDLQYVSSPASATSASTPEQPHFPSTAHRRSTTGDFASTTSLPGPAAGPGGSRSYHKRSSLVSLSKLVSAGQAAERTRYSLDSRPTSSELREKPAPSNHRISRLMSFWKSRERKPPSL